MVKLIQLEIMLNGIICVNKPQDFTSFDVVGKLRGILKIKRIGHTGTLDPMATGVLPVMIGTATKACDIMSYQEKAYNAVMKFGCISDTQDVWGNVEQFKNAHRVTKENFENILPQFVGDIMQKPPMYSAVSVNGKRLYELARKGMTVERPKRKVYIKYIKLISFNEEEQTAEISVHCGKGTYIRTLISDIGQALNSGAIMTGLVRTMACGYTLEDSFTFEQIEEYNRENKLESIIQPIDSVFNSYPKVKLNEAQTRMYSNGVKLKSELVRGIDFNFNSDYRVYGSDDKFIGIGKVNDDNLLCVRKNF